MTQSQQTHQEYLASLKFHSLSSISTWANKPLGAVQLLNLSVVSADFPYIEKDGIYYYFGNYGDTSPEYRLVCTALQDLGAEK